MLFLRWDIAVFMLFFACFLLVFSVLGSCFALVLLAAQMTQGSKLKMIGSKRSRRAQERQMGGQSAGQILLSAIFPAVLLLFLSNLLRVFYFELG